MGFFDKVGEFFGNATGITKASSFQQMGAPTGDTRAQAINYAGIPNAPKISAEGLNQQAATYAQQQRQQNIAGYNAAVASQRGVNPNSAIMGMGNNLANANASMAQNLGNVQAQNTWQSALANQGVQQQTNLANQNMLMGYYGQQSNNFNAAQQGNMQSAEAAAGRSAGFFNNLVGAAGGIASAFALGSDERNKEPVGAQEQSTPEHEQLYQKHIMGREEMAAGGQQESSKFLDTLKPEEFQYKSGSGFDDGGQPHLGIMAQNLEKTPEGASAVHESPEGKVIDIRQLAGMLAAGLGNIHERLQKLEGNHGRV